MEARHAKVSVVLLDACRDNPLPTGTKSASKGLATPAAARSGMVIGFATLPGQTAEDGEGSNSPFATALIKVLPTPGIDLRTALNKVAELTPTLSPRHDQQPQFYQTYVPDVFLVSGGVTQISTAATVETLTVTSNPGGAEILVNGVFRGKAPVTLSDVPVGQAVTVRGELFGYRPYEKRVQVSKGQALAVGLPLSKSVTAPVAGAAPTAASSRPALDGMSAAEGVVLAGSMVDIRGGTFRMGDCGRGWRGGRETRPRGHGAELSPRPDAGHARAVPPLRDRDGLPDRGRTGGEREGLRYL